MLTRILIGALGIFLGACQSGQKSPPLITLEAARQEVSNLQNANLDPPERSIEQILKNIQDLSITEEKLRKIGVIKESCPDKIDRFEQYNNRISELRRGYGSEGEMFLGERQKLFSEGYFSENLDIALRGISALGSSDSGSVAVLHSHLALSYAISGDIISPSDSRLSGAIRRLKRSKSSIIGTFWYQHDGDRVLYLHLTVLEGLRAHFDGEYPVAEVYFRAALNVVLNESYGYEIEREHIYYWLTKNLLSQGRLLHAEYSARRGLSDRPKAALRSILVSNLIKVLNDQGRLEEAEKFSIATLKYLDAICVPRSSYFYALTQFSYASTLSLQGKIRKSDSQLDAISRNFGSRFPDIYHRQFSRL